MALVVKNPPASAGDSRDMGSIAGLEDLLEEGMATHSSILNWRIPMNRGAWQATVLRGHKESDRTEQQQQSVHATLLLLPLGFSPGC